MNEYKLKEKLLFYLVIKFYIRSDLNKINKFSISTFIIRFPGYTVESYGADEIRLLNISSNVETMAKSHNNIIKKFTK